MKRVLILAVGFLFMTQLPCFAEETSTANNMSTPTLSGQTSADVADHTHSYVDNDTIADLEDDDEVFDYGLYFDLVYNLNELVDVGIKNSYEFQRNEFTTLAGVTLKFGGKEKSEDSWR